MRTVVKIWKSFTDESVKRSEMYFDLGINILGRPTHLPIPTFSILQRTSVCLHHSPACLTEPCLTNAQGMCCAQYVAMAQE